ncbi:hypothetical protein BH09MYX1_BH09MYX1_08280 [soil metagenome]
MRRLLRISAAAAVVLSVATFADAKLTKTNDEPSVSFHAVGSVPGLKIDGTTNELNVSDDGTNVKISVPLAKLDTKVALRNDHMRNKYLEVGTFPNAELTVARSALKLPAVGASTSGDATGTMKIHGKEKQVTFHYAAGNSGGKISVKGSVHLNINDYGIVIPSYAGVTMKPDIDIEVAFVATDG